MSRQNYLPSSALLRPTDMRYLLLYLMLVGIPVLGVLAILRAGQGITAPRAVSGSWTFDVPIQHRAPGGCLENQSGPELRSLIVSQSGPSLDVTLQGGPPIALHGSILRDTIRLESRKSGSRAEDLAVVSLRATLRRGAPSRLAGVIDAGCGPVAFSATRVGAEGSP